jgi:hypothetical protein
VKYLTISKARLAALPLAPAALALSLLAGGCADDRVGRLSAETDGPGGDSAKAAPAAQSYAPEDTATRTAAQAIAMAKAAFVSQDSAQARADSIAAAADTIEGAVPAKAAVKYNAGENPAYARSMGWPVASPKPLPGALLPERRLLCYYGNPNSKKMGVLGEYPKDQMLAKLDQEIAKWNKADPAHPVTPCLHMVAVVAQGEPGTSKHYRAIMQDTFVNEVYSWAKSRNGVFVVDIQVGTDRIQNLLPRFEWILKNPDVHLAVDPEFMMKGGQKPGTKIGTMDASDINYVTGEMARIIRENHLPPKVLVIHRFTRDMVTNSKQIILRPEIQLVMDMDGWGAPWLKRDSYRDYIVREPVEYTGFKLFYHNDTKSGEPMMSPADLMKLHPTPLYVQYQ